MSDQAINNFKTAFFDRFGHPNCKAPLLVPTRLLLNLAGETYRERLCAIDSHHDSEYCLRPDFTLPITLSHLEERQQKMEYVYDGPIFRKPQSHNKSLPFEIPQIGSDAFMTDSSHDFSIESFLKTWELLKAHNIGDIYAEISFAGVYAVLLQALDFPPLLRARLSSAKYQPKRLRSLLLESPKDINARFKSLLSLKKPEALDIISQEIVARGNISAGRSPETIYASLHTQSLLYDEERPSNDTIDTFMAFINLNAPMTKAMDVLNELQTKSELETVFRPYSKLQETLKEIDDIEIHIVPVMAHRFEYYDGFNFDIKHRGLKNETLAAGGQFDGLIQRLSGDKLPLKGAGVALRLDRIEALLAGEAHG